MIVVFVVDTSPSMSRPVSGDSGMSRLDLAKMSVEDLARRLRKTSLEHNAQAAQRSLQCLGQGLTRQDALLLLSTSRQHPDTANCAAGGRLLVGFGSDSPTEVPDHPVDLSQHHHVESFQRELKGLVAAKWDPTEPFPEDAGGANGLNIALSTGLQLLSRYRLQNRLTENFGMGRLPNIALQLPNGSPATSALQPACLILVTDGACLRQSASAGGGSLQLQYGSQLLREFYKEPFRWDQRIFCLAIGDYPGENYLHPQLRALCDVTGGSHWMVKKPSGLPTDSLLKHLRPPMPRELPFPEPLFLRIAATTPSPTITISPGVMFINGGPICAFQAFEGEEGKPPVVRRAMLLYTGSSATTHVSTATGDATSQTHLSQPLWCIPEAFFPSKKLDTLPPRPAQPLLSFSKYPSNLGLRSFDPIQVIKMLHRLDQLVIANKKALGQHVRCLHRDVYVCEWLSPEGGKPVQVSISSRTEYFPVFCVGAGRPTLSEESESYLNIGILHSPPTSSTLSSQAGPSRLSTLTLLPPEPHILLPILIRAAEAEHRMLKKGLDKQKMSVPLDEHWRSEFQAYLFRLPPYYQHTLKRGIRSVVPASAQSLLHTEAAGDAMLLQCMSKVCLQKIRNAEQISRDTNERLERQEASLRVQAFAQVDSSPRHPDERAAPLRYGHYDPRSSVESYLAALRQMPPPWRVPGGHSKVEETKHDIKSETASMISEKELESPRHVIDSLGELPARCLMAFYESRRRWIFGGPSLSTRGVHVEGVSNDGSNSHRCGRTSKVRKECLLSIAGVGVSVLNESSTTKMGDYRERLLFSRSPVVGYGSNDAAGVSATTAADGSPVWSVDDDAMPVTFFDPKTGEFADSVQARVRSRLMVNFGNPYKERRADSLIPEKFYSQAPSMQQGGFGSIVGSPRTPPGSPPHDSFDSMEEGEAIFVRKSPARSSPKSDEPDEPVHLPEAKRLRTDSMDDKDPSFEGFEIKPLPASDLISESTSKPPPPPKPAVEESTECKPPAPPKPGSPPPVPVHMRKGSISLVTPSVRQPPPPKPAPPKAAPPPRPKVPPPNAAVPPSQSTVGKAATQYTTAATPANAPVKPPAQLPSMPTNKSMDMIRQTSDTSVKSITSQPPASSILTEDDLQTPDKKPTVDLPAGWMCVWSKSQKRWYFFDTKSNKSVWKWPP